MEKLDYKNRNLQNMGIMDSEKEVELMVSDLLVKLSMVTEENGSPKSGKKDSPVVLMV